MRWFQKLVATTRGSEPATPPPEPVLERFEVIDEVVEPDVLIGDNMLIEVLPDGTERPLPDAEADKILFNRLAGK